MAGDLPSSLSLGANTRSMADRYADAVGTQLAETMTRKLSAILDDFAFDGDGSADDARKLHARLADALDDDVARDAEGFAARLSEAIFQAGVAGSAATPVLAGTEGE